MKVSLILIGNELLNGKIQDTNGKWLSTYAFNNQWQLQNIQIIADVWEDFQEALKNALSKADVVITSGGLGPTPDDLTKDFLARYFDQKMEFNPHCLAITQENYKRQNRVYAQEKFNYHILPLSFYALNNPNGHAPGFGFKTKENKIILCAPGVPSEFQAIVSHEFKPLIEKELGTTLLLQEHFIIKTKGLKESQIFLEIAPTFWESLKQYGTVSSLPHLLGVDLGVTLQAENAEALKALKDKVLKLTLESNLKDYIWHLGQESLEEVIIAKARAANLTFAFAESCTGGLCSHRITNISGASAVFWGSVVSYDNSVKEKNLNVSSDILKKFGAISTECAQAMAHGVQQALKVDIGISITGIAGPGGGSVDKPVGTVAIGIAANNLQETKLYHFNGDREQLKTRFSQIALFTLLDYLSSR
jgi:nicotinamide-nucleotide amidase